MSIAPWHNEHPLTPDQICTLLTRQCPALAVTQVQRLSEGWDNVTWLVNQQWLFRFPKHSNAARLLNHELKLLPALSRLPLDIPKPQWIGMPSEHYPYTFYGHAFLQGETLDRCVLSHHQRLDLAIPIAQFLKALHAFPMAEAQALGITHRVDPLFKVERVQKSVRYLYQHGVFSTPQTAVEFFATQHTMATSVDKVLAHGDFYARHLLVNQQCQVTAIIDWGDAELIHPAVDLAIVYKLLPREAHSVFWHHYGVVSVETRSLAKLRAIYSAITLLWYAHETQDEALFTEELLSWQHITESLYDDLLPIRG